MIFHCTASYGSTRNTTTKDFLFSFYFSHLTQYDNNFFSSPCGWTKADPPLHVSWNRSEWTWTTNVQALDVLNINEKLHTSSLLFLFILFVHFWVLHTSCYLPTGYTKRIRLLFFLHCPLCTLCSSNMIIHRTNNKQAQYHHSIVWTLHIAFCRSSPLDSTFASCNTSIGTVLLRDSRDFRDSAVFIYLMSASYSRGLIFKSLSSFPTFIVSPTWPVVDWY